MGAKELIPRHEVVVEKVINRARFRKLDEDKLWEFYVLPEAWRAEVCKGFDATAIAKAMIAKEWMISGDAEHNTSKPRVPGHGPTRVYRVVSSFLAGEEAQSPKRADVKFPEQPGNSA